MLWSEAFLVYEAYFSFDLFESIIPDSKLPTDYKCISHDEVHNVSGMAVKIVNEFNDERIVLLNEKQHHNL